MTAGVHDAAATELATDEESNGFTCVDDVIGVTGEATTEDSVADAVTTTAVEDEDVDELFGEDEQDSEPAAAAPEAPEELPVAAEPSAGRQVITRLGEPVLRGLHKLDTSLQTLGRLFDLAARAFAYLITDLIRLRHPWRDTINQAWFIVSVTAIPALLVSIPFGVIVAVQVGNFIQQVGASSVSGAAGGLGVIRQGAPMVAALLLGGAAGSAVSTDLGARTIREEVDALRVMGIDPIQRLVTPRLAAIVFVAPVLCAFIIFMGLAAGYAINVGFQSGTPGSYIASFASFASVSDVVVAVIKTWLFGVVVILVACQRGLEAKGGARGVADAVNASVVIGVVAVFVLNLIITQGVSMSMPLRMG